MNDPNLINRIVIHDNKGNLVSSLEMEEVVVSLQFLDTTQLLIVHMTGTYLLYNCRTRELSNLLRIGETTEFYNDIIQAAKTIGNSLVFITRNQKVYIKEIGARYGSHTLVFEPTKDTELLNDGLPYFALGQSEGPELQTDIYLPLKSGGVLKVTHATKPNVERLLVGTPEPFIRLSVSPNGENLAALTKSGMLIVLYIKNPGNSWKKSLETDEYELSQLQKLEWVACYAVALIFNNKLKLACCGSEEDYFEPDFKGEASFRRANYIITRSEIDGLRVIRIFENSPKQTCSIIRRNLPAYAKLQNRFSGDIPSSVLIKDAYQGFVDEKPLEDQDDVRQFKNKLIEGVIDLIECGCFEIDEVH